MMKMLNKYNFNLAWNSEDEIYLATCSEFPTLSAFGDSPQEALAEMETVLEMALSVYEEQGWPLPEPKSVSSHSGQFRARFPKSVHAALARQADNEGVSLNTLVVNYVSECLGMARALNSVGTITGVLDQKADKLLIGIESIANTLGQVTEEVDHALGDMLDKVESRSATYISQLFELMNNGKKQLAQFPPPTLSSSENRAGVPSQTKRWLGADHELLRNLLASDWGSMNVSEIVHSKGSAQ